MPQLIKETVSKGLLTKALLIRQVEQRLLKLFVEGKLFGTVHTCIGQEWSAIAIADCLREGDLIFSNHRCHGHYLARTDDVEGLVAEVMGKKSGMCGGRGGSQHICSKGFFSNGIQGGIAPVASGLAFAQKLKGKRESDGGLRRRWNTRRRSLVRVAKHRGQVGTSLVGCARKQFVCTKHTFDTNAGREYLRAGGGFRNRDWTLPIPGIRRSCFPKLPKVQNMCDKGRSLSSCRSTLIG